jgi:type IV secretion system protein TrbB
VGSVSLKSEAASRSVRMLRTAMGPAITGWLEDPAIVEIMLNPDGRLRIDRLTGGLSDTGKRMSAEDGERIVRLVAPPCRHRGAYRIAASFGRTARDRRTLPKSMLSGRGILCQMMVRILASVTG